MILVVGPGRSGTSTIARLLHDELGISMGEQFRAPDAANPKGYYEDLEFKRLHEQLFRGVNAGQTFEEIRSLVEKRRAGHGEKWGIKDPRLCYLLDFYLSLEPYRVIRCVRNRFDVALSMNRCYGWPYTEALNETLRREHAIAAVNYRRAYQISFSTKREDDDLVDLLRRDLCQLLNQ